ncbi:MAG: hypothetical protein PUC65_16840 [Clostridiales bacterium]|nr:hypothetical protein [Clostridiales bacterium]
MREQLILLVASFFGGVLCMILHEAPKVIIYRNYIKKNIKSEIQVTAHGKVNPIHFIDPIGLLFCVIFRVGFSKPSYYRMKDKRLNRTLGIVGIMSLMIQFLLTAGTLRFGLGANSKLILPANSSFSYEFLMYFLASYAIICIGMLITNLFPLLTTDMSWILTSSKPMTFVTLLKSDYLVKMVWLLLVVLRVIPQLSFNIFRAFMG